MARTGEGSGTEAAHRLSPTGQSQMNHFHNLHLNDQGTGIRRLELEVFSSTT